VENVKKRRAELKSHLMTRGYKEPLIDTQLEKGFPDITNRVLTAHHRGPEPSGYP